ncbi:MAG: hypothetical protein COW65_13070 [Cytophagales bacterium CG18_big_fil_WC_8_21_14_2_50_42_9]|nr:MAG: hypothetical protein COW65_13070 [Cytophagales bacterium CG18_big_fil_WC_8_21_14_2_50_42_9]
MSSAPTLTQASLKVDAYLAQMPPFAQVICLKLRTLILQSDPDIKENWKWSAPVYEENGLICAYSAFKQHVRLSFFQGAYLADAAKILTEGENNATIRSIKFSDVSQIDEALLQQYIREAAQLTPAPTKKATRELVIPLDFAQALEQNEPANEAFKNLSYTNRKEYVVWLEQAKKPETRVRRLQQALTRLTAKI